MSMLYKIFGEPWKDILDFSDEMLIEMYNYESYGGHVSKNNGYSVGKKWLNVHVKMWNEDIEKGFLLRKELYEDGKYPEWWLKKVIS